MKIFIIGITGRVGSYLADLLAADGDEVGGLVRNAARATRMVDKGVHAVVGDLVTIDPQKLAGYIDGFDAVVFTAGAAGDLDVMTDAIDGDGVDKLIAAMRQTQVRRVYLVSVFPEAGRGGEISEGFEHYIEVKKRADVNLAASSLDWVILRPSTLTDEPCAGTVSLSFAQYHTTVTVADVACTLHALIHSPSVNRVILELTSGPVPVARAVGWVAEELGRREADKAHRS
jgi:nucleoside-diphosphate-sugar epimerase